MRLYICNMFLFFVVYVI